MQTTRKSLRKNQLEKEQTVTKSSNLDFIKIFLFILSFLGLMLVLIGYGYKLGIASTFGYGPLEIVTSSSDFIYDSAVPLLRIAAEIFKINFWADLFLSTSILTTIAAVTSTLLVAYSIARYLRNTPLRRHKTRRWLEEQSVSYLDRALLHDGPIRGFFRVLLTTPTYVTLGFILILIVVYVLMTLVLIVPKLGYAEGVKVAKDYVINAKVCSPHDNDKEPSKGKSAEKEKMAQCVRVVEHGKEVVRGRVIGSNDSRILLYVKEYRINDKGQKEAIRIPKSYPIRNAVIERVDTEDLPIKVYELSDVEHVIKDYQLTELPLSCLSYEDLGVLDNKQTFIVREKHDGKCGGEPNTSPRLFTIAIDEEGVAWSDVYTKNEGGDLVKLFPKP